MVWGINGWVLTWDLVRPGWPVLRLLEGHSLAESLREMQALQSASSVWLETCGSSGPNGSFLGWCQVHKSWNWNHSLRLMRYGFHLSQASRWWSRTPKDRQGFLKTFRALWGYQGFHRTRIPMVLMKDCHGMSWMPWRLSCSSCLSCFSDAACQDIQDDTLSRRPMAMMTFC